MTDLANLDLNAFEPLIGEAFRLGTDVGDIDLVLHEAYALGPALRTGGSFSLVFRAMQDRPIAQQLYRLHHPALGDIQLFLVPIGPLGGDFGYEAILT